MIELADQRRIADLEEMRAPRDERQRYEVHPIELTKVMDLTLTWFRNAADEFVVEVLVFGAA